MSDKNLLALLHLSNKGKEWFDDQWQVQSIDSNGCVRAINKHDGISVNFFESEVVQKNVKQGGDITVRRANNLLYTSPGYYLAISDAGLPEADCQITRLYMNLKWEGCCRMVSALSELASKLTLKLYFKVANNRKGYNRADAGVIYMATESFLSAKNELMNFFEANTELLDDKTSFFANRLCHGIAVAVEDSGANKSATKSFGERASEELARRIIKEGQVRLEGQLI